VAKRFLCDKKQKAAAAAAAAEGAARARVHVKRSMGS